MKKKFIFLFAIVLLVLTGCGKDQSQDTIALKDHNGKEVAFPQDKPSIFFFITTYT
ncbi:MULTISPECIES: hypothetical protein [unclassified Cytobacillus]|uniref:hypothetical protein n=1 Tax=unclassified Cytobacillus TaxID=2675268 RepID=UPI0013FA1FC9|nr:hypothetical protein [Cytobacillus sp. AMY 15.2]KAF0817353.1 hypothetical protein KIS4809_3835 [Bacillus sp. ZZV12-4809]MCM3092819.1 hypothetical protein [Cytobacillus sp. AMY 15.2]